MNIPSPDRVIFRKCSQMTYDGIIEKDPQTVYWVTDSGRLYLGDKEFNSVVEEDIIKILEENGASKEYVQEAIVNFLTEEQVTQIIQTLNLVNEEYVTTTVTNAMEEVAIYWEDVEDGSES